jgi:hypothetical protein
MVRFLLYANEWDIEGIVTSSSQYHWHGHRWAGDDWIDPYLKAYAEIYPNLVKHDPNYPTPEYLKERTALGNVAKEGEMDKITAGSQLIVKVLLDKSDNRPVWLQAWGGPNTISRALKTIEEEHPERMQEVADKIRLFLIWEQDSTYQSYIRKHWGKYNILTIISDQFEAIAYRWKNIQPKELQPYFSGPWMNENILNEHGPLCTLYKAHKTNDKGFVNGDFRSEGDSPAFMHSIVTGLRSMESPDWGGWGGRYVWVRENTWLDPVPEKNYTYPKGRWYGSSAWGRNSSKKGLTTENSKEYREYFKPIWRWSKAFQNDFAARADWCIKSFEEANHAPVVKIDRELDLTAKPGTTIQLSAEKSSDPDGDEITYNWWFYKEASTYKGEIEIKNPVRKDVRFTLPENVQNGKTVHIICEITDNGVPQLTRYKRIIVEVIE